MIGELAMEPNFFGGGHSKKEEKTFLTRTEVNKQGPVFCGALQSSPALLIQTEVNNRAGRARNRGEGTLLTQTEVNK